MNEPAANEVARIDNRLFVLILQHPQEQDRELGSARLAVSSLAQASLVVGLSWPNLGKALGRPADPRRWAVLYLGSTQPPPGPAANPVLVLDRAGRPINPPAGWPSGLDGLIALDGTWSQAKALWWRNPWLLKTTRIALDPAQPSRYGLLRKEPRREGLSTIEAIGLALSRLEGRPEIEICLTSNFDMMLRCLRAERTRAVPPTNRP